MTAVEMAAGVACLACAGAWSLPARHDATLLIVLAVACTLVPSVLSLAALRHLTAFSAALAVNLEPVYTILLAAVLLGEHRDLTPAFYVGVAIILAAVFSHRQR
jgi:drug/metabolite transporter (DMT)-like permease